MVDECLLRLKEKNLCSFTSPTGGYFVSFESTNSKARGNSRELLKSGP